MDDSKNINLANLIKHTLLLGADKLLMARKPGPFPLSEEFHDINETNNTFMNTKLIKGTKHASSKNNKSTYAVPSTSASSSSGNKAVDLLLKLATFQISLFINFLTFPIWFSNLCLMFFMFPFQTLTHVRDHMKKKLLKAFNASYLKVIAFVCNRLKLGLRFGRAFFCMFYVFSVLLGLLVSGFVMGGIIMRNLVEESLHTSETLNFDYTKPSPAAVVPIAPSLVPSENVGGRAIPCNHKLQAVVSLTLPESEYNRKLGIFQVRVETLSSNGRVILGSSYPTMLHFKSQPIRVVETIFNSVPLIIGLKSEVQNLKIVMKDVTEGLEPTTCFKVILEQRAEFQAGSGVPEIYGGSLEITSELPQLKRLLWSWRRTIFVWISFGLFVGEMMVFMIFLRPLVFLGRRSAKGVGSEKKSLPGKISWCKAN